MYSHVLLGAVGVTPGAGAQQSLPPSARKHQAVRHRAFQSATRLHIGHGHARAQQDNVSDSFVKRLKSKERGPEPTPGSGLDLGSVFRSVFDFSSNSPKVAPAASAAATAAISAATVSAAARPSAAAALDAAAAAAAFDRTGAVPAGPFAAAQMAAAAASSSSAAAAAGVQPLATLAEHVLTTQGAVQDDPVAAARQLQLFLAQYRDQYGPETDARISAAIAKLQDYIEGYSQQQQPFGEAGGLQNGMGAAAAAAGGAAADGSSGGEGVVYHNYILEQLTGILDWVNNLLVNSNPKPYVFDVYGRVLDNPAAATSVEQQQEQLRAASNSLRVLIQQLQQVNRQYAAMADPDEKAAMGQVLSQLTTMADRLAVAATRRPLPPVPAAESHGAVTAAIDTAAELTPYVRPEDLYGTEKYRDPLLRVLDGVYQAVVVDSGLREFLAGIKQLGDSLVSSMAVAWTGAPPIGRLIAYIAAVAGVLFVMRTRLPTSLLAPTKMFGQLGAGSGGGGGKSDGATGPISNSDSSNNAGGGGGLEPGSTVAANPAAAAAFAAIASGGNGSGNANGQEAAAAAAAAFAAIAANSGGGRAAGPLAAMDRDAGLGDTRLPSEILASNDPYAARSALIDTQATSVSASASAASVSGEAAAASGGQAGGGPRRSGGSSGGFGNGWATLTGAAAAPAPAASSSSSPGSGLFTSPSFPSGSLPRAPSGGWTSQYSDRADWWSIGQQQPQTATTTAGAAAAAKQAPSPPPPPQSPAPASRAPTVAESWEAFRRIQEASGAGTAAAATGGGMLDTTAALAAAAVAAAAVGSGGGVGAGDDPKMAELARATEERRLSRDRARLRATIKDRLRWVCLALGPVSSVVPGGEPLRDEVDGLLAQLEALSPTDKPLNTVVDVARRPTVGPPVLLVDPLLLGEWRLVYASNASAAAGTPSAASQAAGGGPNLLAQILHIADSLPGFGMTHVVQRLTLETPPQAAAGGAGSGGARSASAATAPTVLTENSAVFRFGPLGSWRVSVRGRWVDNGGGLCAAAEFESFCVRPVDLWGLPVEELLPEVAVPVPEVLRSRSEWCTTYLDEEMRVGRGSGGALFLFRRGGVADAEQPAAATAPPPPPPLRPSVPAAAAAPAATQQPAMRPL